MKNVIKMLVLTMCIAVAAPAATAQMSDKELKKELKAKADKESRKEAKKLEKEGWKVMPGKLSLEKQLMESKYAELDEDENGQKLYFIGTNQSVGGNYTAAKQIADSRARLELARAINSTIAEKIQETMSTKDFGEGDVESVSEFISANSAIVAAQLQGVMPVLEIYREGAKNTTEVMVLVKVNAAQALKNAKMAYRLELEKKSEKMAKDLDNILPY